MRPRVYLETTIVSYLVGWLNQHDLYVAAQQEFTRDWWANKRAGYELGGTAVIDDPIVAEIHETRERLLREYGDMNRLLNEFRAIEAEMKDRVVRLEPRPPVDTKRRVS